MTDEFELVLTKVKKPSQVSFPDLIGLYGPAGNGKSWFAASASLVKELSPVLIIDTEGSTTGAVSSFDDDSIDIYDLTEIDDDIDKLRALNTLVRKLTTQTHKYNTVIIDTFDVAQKWAKAKFMEDNPTNNFAAWDELSQWTIGTLRKLKAAPFLAIVNFHEKEETLDTGAKMSRLVLQGSSKDEAPGVFDLIGIATRREDKELKKMATTVRFAPNPRRATKNRFEDSIPPELVDKTMLDVYNLIKNANTKDKKED